MKFPEICLSIHTIYTLHKTWLNHRQLNGQIPLIPLGLRSHYFTVHLGVCGKIKKVACSPSASLPQHIRKLYFLISLTVNLGAIFLSSFYSSLPPCLSPINPSFPPFLHFLHYLTPFFLSPTVWASDRKRMGIVMS